MRNKKSMSFMDGLAKSENQALLQNVRQDQQVMRSVPLLYHIEEDTRLFSTFWLHASIRRDCYYFCTTYSYQVWVTTDKAGKEKIEAEEISLRIRRNGAHADYIKQKSNISECKHVEEVSGTDKTGGVTKLTAAATLFGNTWGVEVRL